MPRPGPDLVEGGVQAAPGLLEKAVVTKEPQDLPQGRGKGARPDFRAIRSADKRREMERAKRDQHGGY